MNDFTKEELNILFLEINIAIRNWGDAKEYKDYPKLKSKIQSMIDNYCEHDYSITCITPTGRFVMQCPKCGKGFIIEDKRGSANENI